MLYLEFYDVNVLVRRRNGHWTKDSCGQKILQHAQTIGAEKKICHRAPFSISRPEVIMICHDHLSQNLFIPVFNVPAIFFNAFVLGHKIAQHKRAVDEAGVSRETLFVTS